MYELAITVPIKKRMKTIHIHLYISKLLDLISKKLEEWWGVIIADTLS